MTYTSFVLPVQTVTPPLHAAEEQLEHEFTAPVVATVVGASGAPSTRTTLTPVAPAVHCPFGTYAVTSVPWISTDRDEVGRQDSEQAPETQVCEAVHTWPHAPQLLTSLFSLTHAPAQSVVPGVVHWHDPPVHAVPVPQTVPHAPQLLLSVCSLTHADPQSAVPDGHTHDPLEQSCPGIHEWPHEPQLFTSEAKLVQTEGDEPLSKQQFEAPAAHTASW